MWREAAQRTGRRLSDRGWTPEVVSGVAFLLLSSVAGLVMDTPKAAIYGAAAGLTILIWVFAYSFARSVSVPPAPAFASAGPAALVPNGSPGALSPTTTAAPAPDVAINAPVQGSVIISQGQAGGQVANTINNYGPPKRQLTSTSRNQMLATLKAAKGSCIAFASTQGDVEAHEFKLQLMSVFKGAGWDVRDHETFMFFGSRKGIVLTIPFKGSEDGLPQVVMQALNQTGQPVSGNRGGMANDCGFYVQVWHSP